MIYTWRCRGCGQAVEVQRSVAEHDRGPEGDELVHDGCTGERFKRVITAPSRVFVHENEESYFKRMTAD